MLAGFIIQIVITVGVVYGGLVAIHFLTWLVTGGKENG